MVKLLVTGGAGYLGGHVLSLAERDDDVLALPLRELTDEGIDAFGPEAVIHLAALTNADDCEANPDDALELNVREPRRIARACRQTVRTFLYASTDLVFDGDGSFYRESDEPRPGSVYGRTKLDGERAVQDELADKATIVRVALLYGPRRSETARASFAETMVERARASERVVAFEDQFRTPLYVEDAAENFLALVANARTEPIVHLGGPERASRYDMARVGFEVFDLPKTLLEPRRMDDHAPDARRPRDVSLDDALARRIGLRARGVREGFEAFRDRMRASWPRHS